MQPRDRRPTFIPSQVPKRHLRSPVRRLHFHPSGGRSRNNSELNNPVDLFGGDLKQVTPRSVPRSVPVCGDVARDRCDIAQVDYIDSAEACASECAALPNCTHWCASPHRARQLPLNPPSPRPASTTRGGAQDALETLRHMLAQGTGIRRGGAESVRWAHLGTAAGGRAGGGRAGGRVVT